ncbi:hypothetical protein ABZZ20_35535 [Streptomyces sp. NPDC006430]|uniref:hypothetical protein n=1 Tax=Streptomyces sp. NPDC006430 TaxID=3154299 RepID=UPI0033AA064A
MTTTRSTFTVTARHRAPDDWVRATRVPRQPAHAAGGAPLFDELAREWAARGATVPGQPDPAWRRLVSWEHFRHETETTVRNLHLRGAEPTPEPAPPSAGRPRWQRV